MSEAIAALRKKVDSGFEPEKIDWGYCIPDCGRCCTGSGKEATPEEAAEISRRLGIPEADFIQPANAGAEGSGSRLRPRLFMKTENGICIFLTGRRLCVVYAFKPRVCTKYGLWMSDCRDFRRIKELSDKSVDIKGRLKKAWLEEIMDAGYDRVKWKVRSEIFIDELMHVRL